jgi:putative membrane protein insertion efficiency factor
MVSSCSPNMNLFRRLYLLPIQAYRRFVSPLKPQATCRFHPSCSAYAEEAIKVHGVIYGTYLSTLRVLKCQPFHPGGFDPVPEKRTGAKRRHVSEEF